LENVHFLMQLIKQKLKIINLTLSQFFSQKNIEKISYKNSITSKLKKNLSYFFFFLIIFLFPKKREEPNLSKQKTNRKKKLKKK